MGEDPEVIRRDIERTRAELSETIAAMGDEADVKSRAKGSVADKTDAVKSKLTGATSRASEATPSAQDVKQGAKRVAGVAQENPLGLALGGVAVGFLAGMVVPSTRVEDERLGPVADQVKEKARETGQEAVERVSRSRSRPRKAPRKRHRRPPNSTGRSSAQARSSRRRRPSRAKATLLRAEKQGKR